MQSKNTKQLKEAFESWRLYTSINEEKDYTPGPGEEEQYTEGPAENRKYFDTLLTLSLMAAEDAKLLYVLSPKLFGLKTSLEEKENSPPEEDISIILTTGREAYEITKNLTVYALEKAVIGSDNVVELEDLLQYVKNIDMSEVVKSFPAEIQGGDKKQQEREKKAYLAALERHKLSLIKDLRDQITRDKSMLGLAMREWEKLLEAASGDETELEALAETFRRLAIGFTAGATSAIAAFGLLNDFFTNPSKIAARLRKRKFNVKIGPYQSKYRDPLSHASNVGDLKDRFSKKFFSKTSDSVLESRTSVNSANAKIEFDRAYAANPDFRSLQKQSGRKIYRKSYIDMFLNFMSDQGFGKFRVPRTVLTLRSRIFGGRAGRGIDPTAGMDPDPNVRASTAGVGDQLNVDLDTPEGRVATEELENIKNKAKKEIKDLKEIPGVDPRDVVPVDPELKAKVDNKINTLEEKARWVDAFLEELKEFSKYSAGKDTTLYNFFGKILLRIRAYAKIGGAWLVSKMPIASPLTAFVKYALTATFILGAYSYSEKIKLFLGVLGEYTIGYLLEVLAAADTIPGIDMEAELIKYLEFKARSAHRKLKAVKYIYADLKGKNQLDDHEKVILASLKKYYEENTKLADEFVRKAKKVPLKPTPDKKVSDTPPSPTQAKQSVLDLMESSNNKKLKITLGTINESKKPLNNKKLKITLG